MISLSNGPMTLALNPDLRWTDEHAWSPVQQAVERSITGALVVSIGVRIAGRPITLEPVDDDSGGTSLADLLILRAWANEPGLQMSLTLRGVTRSVIWRHQDEPALDAAPWVFFSDPLADDLFQATFRFMEV